MFAKAQYDRCLFPRFDVVAYQRYLFTLSNDIPECETSKPQRIPGTNRFTIPPRFLRPRFHYAVYVYIDNFEMVADGLLSSQSMQLAPSNEFVGASQAVVYETLQVQGLVETNYTDPYRYRYDTLSDGVTPYS